MYIYFANLAPLSLIKVEILRNSLGSTASCDQKQKLKWSFVRICTTHAHLVGGHFFPTAKFWPQGAVEQGKFRSSNMWCYCYQLLPIIPTIILVDNANQKTPALFTKGRTIVCFGGKFMWSGRLYRTTNRTIRSHSALPFDEFMTSFMDCNSTCVTLISLFSLGMFT